MIEFHETLPRLDTPLTVADELEYQALPEDVKILCEKIIADRVDGIESTYKQSYRAGYDDGYRERSNEFEDDDD